jgi:hypothetical protein
MFEGWDSFYLMIGPAGGALIGIMFVVATLTSAQGRKESLRAASIYMTPNVTAFAVVLMASALTAVPHLGARPAGAILLAMAAAGVLHALSVCWRIGYGPGSATPHWSDLWCYGIGLAAAYLALGAAALALLAALPWAARAVAAALAALLLLGVRNAWDLVTWLAPAAKGPL